MRLMRSTFTGPVNIGSEEMVSINQLVAIVSDIAGKKILIQHNEGPVGCAADSDNCLLKEKLAWQPTQPLRRGLEATYDWIERQVAARRRDYSGGITGLR